MNEKARLSTQMFVTRKLTTCLYNCFICGDFLIYKFYIINFILK